jgi:hypothetical protein
MKSKIKPNAIGQEMKVQANGWLAKGLGKAGRAPVVDDLRKIVALVEQEECVEK